MYRKITITGVRFKKNLNIVKSENLELEINETITNSLTNLSINETDLECDKEHTITVYIMYVVNNTFLLLHNGKPYTYKPVIDENFKYKKNIKSNLNKEFNIKSHDIINIKLFDTKQNNHIYCVYINKKIIGMKPIFRLINSRKDYLKTYYHNNEEYYTNIHKLFRLIEH